MNVTKEKRRKRIRRHRRVRRKVFGTPERPRLCVFRSLRHMYAQIIDDVAGKTLVSASTQSPSVREALAAGGNAAAAAQVGARLGELALEKGIKQVCFDRAGCKYHGRIKALAEAARKAGLSF